MMRIVAVVAIGVLLGSCAFAVRHPAITAGLVGAVVAGGTCELATHNASGGGGTGEEKACAITTGAVGLGLGLIVAGAILLGGEGHTILVQEPIEEPPAPVHKFKTKAEDGEVPYAAPVDAGIAADTVFQADIDAGL